MIIVLSLNHIDYIILQGLHFSKTQTKIMHQKKQNIAKLGGLEIKNTSISSTNKRAWRVNYTIFFVAIRRPIYMFIE
jgi:hypothetical protein